MSGSSVFRPAFALGIEEIMMIINHVTEGTVSDGGQNVIRFVIRFGYTYLGKVGNVANFVSVHSEVPSQYTSKFISETMYFALGQNKVTIISRVPMIMKSCHGR